MNIFEDYLKALKTFKISEITESTHRGKLQDLLETIAKDINPKIKIIHEPKREGKFGSPDYKVIIADNIIGYIENKAIDEDLNKVLKSEQIEKYKNLSDNIIITNYIEFIWLKDGRVTKRENLSYLTDFEDKKTKLDLNREEAVKELIKNFFSQAPKGISSTKKLAEALSVRAKLLKDFLFEELKRQEKEHTEGKLYGLYQTFKKYVFSDLLVEEFSDTFAQNLVYGLFLAKLNADTDNINLYNAKKYISSSFELIKELVGFLDELDKEEYLKIRWVVEEVLTVLNNLDIEAITRKLSFNINKLDKDDYAIRDPYIYFYEDFLGTYDKKLKKSKGVYYTPPQIVNFIIKSIDMILQNIFDIKDGFADHKRVTVLDFATGTGTFLLEIIKNILEKFPEDSGKKELIIKEHILKNIYGFEYLIAPYTIAHLKLSQYLKDKGYSLSNNERFQIFLTNTLEPISKQLKISLLPALSNETNEAQKVKDKPILVITGNPPYNVKSKNNGKWISEKIKDYYYVDGIKLDEKNPKRLQDDYVKFIRFAQFKMANIEEGIVGIITNHSFLDNPTFKGMRKSLLDTFEQIYLINLHGNKKKKEKTPDGRSDENVFDIEQGVAISIFIKKKELKRKIFYTDFWGLREEKYSRCLNDDIDTVEWKELTIEEPFYVFKYQDLTKKKQYNEFIFIKDIFNEDISGFKTGNDDIAIAFHKQELINKLRSLKKNIIFTEDKVKKCLYRPFDFRYVYYSKDVVDRIRSTVMPYMLRENIGLTIGRYGNAVSQEFMWNLVFVSNEIIDLNLFQRGGANIFPLYKYEISENIFSSIENEKKENFTPKFRDYINNLYDEVYSPEKILFYIYGILYSPLYRKIYRDFLNMDFPKIPFIRNKKIFDLVSAIGKNLIDSHLMLNIPEHKLGGFKNTGNNFVKYVEFRENKIFINEIQYFDKIPNEIYNFFIGGYKVLDKYLSDRKNRYLSLEEIENLEKIANILLYSIKQMAIIDDLLKDWI